jgi:hypothetical protein
MTSQGVMRVGNSGLSSHGGKIQNNPILKKLLKFTKSCKNEIYLQECLLFRCRHAVVIMQILNLTNQCSLFMIVRHIFDISEDDHP